MSSTLNIVVDEARAKIALSRYVVLGSEYDLAWAGCGAIVPTLILTDQKGNVVCTSESGKITLTTAELVNLFNGATNPRPVTVLAYAYHANVILGTGLGILHWSPITFETVNSDGLDNLRNPIFEGPGGKFYQWQVVDVDGEPAAKLVEYTGS